MQYKERGGDKAGTLLYRESLTLGSGEEALC
jgi:hypothetical protein